MKRSISVLVAITAITVAAPFAVSAASVEKTMKAAAAALQIDEDKGKCEGAKKYFEDRAKFCRDGKVKNLAWFYEARKDASGNGSMLYGSTDGVNFPGTKYEQYKITPVSVMCLGTTVSELTKFIKRMERDLRVACKGALRKGF